MFSRIALLVSATCAMAACGAELPSSPGGSDSMGVEGKITSAQTGAPISDVRVRLYYRSCSSGYYFEASCTTFFAASTVSDATGWYKVAGHVGHSYNLAAFHPQFLSWDERIGEGNQTQDIVLEARTP